MRNVGERKMKYRIRFEPIDTINREDFLDLYDKIKRIINSVYADDHIELIPSIIKTYPVDEDGLPLKE